MNKNDLISKIASDANISKVDATAALEAVIGGVSGTLSTGGKVTLVGFGTFSTTDRAARKGRNPQTGKEIDIPAKTVVKFKPGKELSEQV
ncbi:MAG: DNA-binding protein HU-beta [Sphingobacteriales bacterium]|jgi:DNA-binding protein HU-beta